jgi:AraC-like DNA-binding protein
MHHVVPGIREFPLSERPLLATREVARAAQMIRQAAGPFQISWEKTSPGTDIRVTGIVLGKMKIFGAYHGGVPVLVRSVPLQSNYIVIPLQGQVLGRIHSTDILAVPGEALIFSVGTCLHARWSESCVALVLCIANEEIDRVARQSMLAASGAPALKPKIDLMTGPGRSFANLLGCLCMECEIQRDEHVVPGITERLQDALLLSLVHLNGPVPSSDLQRVSARRRRAGIDRAVSYLRSNHHVSVAIGELSRVACLSPRSLQVGFGECFGMGPMAYSKRLRLIKAREELQTREVRTATVAAVARHWGFHCASTFIRLYRRQFGELPSRTLRKS